MLEFAEIQEIMHKAGVIGIEIDKNHFPQGGTGKSVLLFRTSINLPYMTIL